MPPTSTSRQIADIKERIRGYVRQWFQEEELSPAIGDDADLLTTLDSLQVLRMLIDLESEYVIEVDNAELTPENLGTINRLALFIASKRQANPCATQK